MMEEVDRKALDRCYTKIISDVDPTNVFTQSLCSKGVLTPQQRDEIDRIPTQQGRAATLMKFIPTRGPKAFAVFMHELDKDYPWLKEQIQEERQNKHFSEEAFASKLAKVIRNKLLPLIYQLDQYPNHYRGISNNTYGILKQLSDSLSLLRYQCHHALKSDICQVKEENAPIHVMICHRLKQEREFAMEDLKTPKLQEEIKELKKEMKTLRKELKERTRTVHNQERNLKDYDKLKKEVKRLKQDVHKYKDEVHKLEAEVKVLQSKLAASEWM